MFTQEGRKIRTTDLFFPFEQKDQVDWQLPLLTKRFFDAKNVRQHLALIVGRTTRPDFAFANFRFKWWILPQGQRVDWLHIIVAINKHRLAIRTMFIPRDHNRMPRRLM